MESMVLRFETWLKIDSHVKCNHILIHLRNNGYVINLYESMLQLIIFAYKGYLYNWHNARCQIEILAIHDAKLIIQHSILYQLSYKDRRNYKYFNYVKI